MNKVYDFRDKVALVTGGAGGIGCSIAEAFASCDARVAVFDKDAKKGMSTVSTLPGSGHLFIHGDAGRKKDVENCAAQVLEQYGHIDFLVNNACMNLGGLNGKCPYEDFLEVLKVGVVAPYLFSLLFLDAFKRGGAIVNISSTRASMSQKNTESYTAAKGGITALTHGMAMSLAGYGLRVNSISPGWIDTGSFSKLSDADHRQQPVGHVGKPEDISALVLFLCSQDASFITGENIVADGGMTRRMIYHGDEGWHYTPS